MPLAGVAAISLLLGEERLFRGLLLPRMGSRRHGGWLANALLSALYHVYQPWMIPARMIAAVGPAWAAERYRSNWIPLAVRLNEVTGLTLATLVGVSSFSFPPLPASVDLPRIERRPPAAAAFVKPLGALPAYDLARGSFSVDLRSRDVSMLDLRSRARDLDCAAFDDRTAWPPAERLPAGFDPARVLEANRNPGLGLRALHARGVTGRGIGIAIIDSPLLAEHREYASRLRWYEEVDTAYPFRPPRPAAHMHGTAVASIAVGETVGVAPEADLFFLATPFESFKEAFLRTHVVAQAMRRIVEINRALPRERKIRAISLSHGWGDAAIGCSDAEAAVALARSEGIAFFSVTHAASYGGLARPPLSDPDSFQDYGLSWLWRTGRIPRPAATNLFYLPMDTRTLASETGIDSLAHFSLGGNSMGPPFLAGVYALAAQVDPTITPERFLEMAARRARRSTASEPQGLSLPILDPGAVVAELGSATPSAATRSDRAARP